MDILAVIDLIPPNNSIDFDLDLELKITRAI